MASINTLAPATKRQSLAGTGMSSEKKAETQTTLSAKVVSSKTPKQNIGGASKLQWFNKFIDMPDLQPALQNLISKIAHYEITPLNCHQVIGFTETSRPQIDTKLRAKFSSMIPDGPERFSPYQISLAKHQVRIPEFQPPPYPQELRKVKQKRSISATENNEKDATWVASHLCHNKRCVNPEHLRWEPSWMNRLRDNCAGGEACIHRPDRCLAPHRNKSELIDWTEYIVNKLEVET